MTALEMKREEYVKRVLELYVELPETPAGFKRYDRVRATELHERGVQILAIESAFLLASVRRFGRPADAPPLFPIRSLAYFLPVIEEVLSNPIPTDYVEYLRGKLRVFAARVQKNTFPRDR